MEKGAGTEFGKKTTVRLGREGEVSPSSPFPSLLPLPPPLPSPGTQATLAILFPLTKDEVVSFSQQGKKGFRVSHRVSSTKL